MKKWVLCCVELVFISFSSFSCYHVAANKYVFAGSNALNIPVFELAGVCFAKSQRVTEQMKIQWKYVRSPGNLSCRASSGN
jgi:hypothetical protein